VSAPVQSNARTHADPRCGAGLSLVSAAGRHPYATSRDKAVEHHGPGGHALLLLALAPLLQDLGIEVRHYRTFFARLAFTLIGLAACGFHPCPSLPAAALHDRVPWRH